MSSTGHANLYHESDCGGRGLDIVLSYFEGEKGWVQKRTNGKEGGEGEGKKGKEGDRREKEKERWGKVGGDGGDGEEVEVGA